MKLLYISKYASFDPYGLETRQFYLSREIAKRGYDATVYLSTANHYHSNNEEYQDEDVNGVFAKWIHTLQYQSAYGVRRILSWFHFEYKLRKELKNVKLTSEDIVIVSSLSLLSVFNGVYLKKKWNCKLVLEVRDIWPLVLKRISNLSNMNPFYRFLAYVEKLGYSKSDIIIGTMPYLSKHVSNIIKFEKEVMWIPHLINKDVDYAESHPYANDLKSLRENGNKIIGYAGSINKTSALEYLIDCAERLEEVGVSVAILGHGPLKDELVGRSTSRNVHFFDKLPQREVVAFLKDCDYLYDGYLRSDIYQFGNSRNKYVEYCLAKKPMVVAFEGSDFFVSKYQCGLVCPVESSDELFQYISTLVQKDKEELDQMAANAFKFADDNLQVNKQVDTLLEKLKNV